MKEHSSIGNRSFSPHKNDNKSSGCGRFPRCYEITDSANPAADDYLWRCFNIDLYRSAVSLTDITRYNGTIGRV